MQNKRQLSAFKIGNFKAFAETQHLPIKPITLIYGPNSAGKSSLIQALAFAHEAQFGREKQTGSRLDIHRTDLGGNAIDLGGFRQFIHRGNSYQRLTWGAEIATTQLASAYLGQAWAAVANITLKLELGHALDEQGYPQLGACPRVEVIELLGDGNELIRMVMRHPTQVDNTLRLDRLSKKHPVITRFLMEVMRKTVVKHADLSIANDSLITLLPELEIHIDQFYRLTVKLPTSTATDDEEPAASGENITKKLRKLLPYWLTLLLTGLTDALDSELKKLQYLGALRSLPARHLSLAEREDPNWYAGGGYAWEIVRTYPEVRAAVNTWLGADKLATPYELGLRSFVALDNDDSLLRGQATRELADNPTDHNLVAEQTTADNISRNVNMSTPNLSENAVIDAEVKRLLNSLLEAKTGHFQELVIIDKEKQTLLNHRDIGTGIAQILPVLVMALGAIDKLIAIEHPEMYLHPSLQAELADVFIESALGAQQNTFILETHSQQLMLRILRRIREGKLSPQEVAVIYVEPLLSGSQVQELRIDAQGDFIDEWPHGFFEETFQETFAGR